MGLTLKILARFAPRQPRATVDIVTWLLLPDDNVATITIRNISVSGFMGETLARVQRGDSFGVVIPGCGIVRAYARWFNAGELGGKFRIALDPKKFVDWHVEDGRPSGFLQAQVRRKPLGAVS